ncbi:Lipoprotein-releasing system ATP-binding protein LolD [Corynebacterium faecale]|uniref:ABC transporter ATP-binding protein n=1 Tax=Corynebacterium faecale TaxID=1758466 RepID=UPI0025B307DB|nr:ABC transporter ATP-binding protein [Corynebacterium faecale]WJY91262.1 Lipoprotein-releasing system ATP-binding protein LolD [Corynebacterium faecale]
MTTPALILDNVRVSYGDGDSEVHALDGVSLSVNPGEFVAIVGPSGSGKSTLLAVAGALTSPHSGDVRVAGESITEYSDKELARIRREHIGFVFQSSGNLPSALKAHEQLELAARVLGRRGRRSNDELLEAVGMSHRANNRPATLSGGERQRIGIARALVGGPNVLLVDEPTAALDRNRAHEIVQLLASECHELGVAGVMVTHDLDVIEHCDRVYDMVDGRLTARD